MNQMIEYTTERRFTQSQVEDLFLTAWDGERLVGLVRGIDDGCMASN